MFPVRFVTRVPGLNRRFHLTQFRRARVRVATTTPVMTTWSRALPRCSRFTRETTREAIAGSKCAQCVSGEGEKPHDMPENMHALTSVSDHELRERLSAAVSTERMAAADVVCHLAELDRRKLYLDDACSSLFAYCVERLGYSEDGANKRVRVARLVQRFPQVLDELASGEVHLTGLFLLSGHLTEENAEQLIAEARGKSKRQLEELIARWSPRPDVPATVTPLAPMPAQTELSTMSGTGNPAPPAQTPRPRVEPLSPARVRVEFTAHAAFREKLEQAQNLLSHQLPSGDLATILELGLELLIAEETKRRSGTGKPRKRRETKPGSRHVPVEVQRAVRERDGDQCTFTRRRGASLFSEIRFLTIEHIDPFAKGGPTTVDNCCLLCQPHNAHRARQVFGEEHIQNKIAEARAGRDANSAPDVPPAPPPAALPERDVSEKVLGALVHSGFKTSGSATSPRAGTLARGRASARADASRRVRRACTLRRFVPSWVLSAAAPWAHA
jgi:5-methylcytosine-specific restriction endonuclease McrA